MNKLHERRLWLWTILSLSILQLSQGDSYRRKTVSSTEDVKAGRECDMRKDVLLMNDPDPVNQSRTFLQCRPAGRGMVGFWQRMLCPEGQKFLFQEQMCNPSSDRNEKAPYVAIVGQSCARGQQCIGGSICDTDVLRCVCPEGTNAEVGTYICQPVEHEPRVILVQRRNKVQQEYNIPMQPPPHTESVSPGSSCKLGEVCSGNSYCNVVYYVCTCPEGTLDRGGNCVPLRSQKGGLSVSPGSICHRLLKCASGSNCIQGRCVCADPLVQRGKTCVMRNTDNVGPGEICDLGQHCIKGSVCSSVTKRCMCPIGTSQSGDECVDNSLVPADRSGVGASCELNTDCIIGAYCNANNYPPTCQCLSTHVEVSQVCYRIIYPGQSGCDFDTQCSAAFDGATCSSNVCICPRGMNAQGQTCRPVGEVVTNSTSLPGESCLENDVEEIPMCLGGSNCYMGLCVCPYGQLAFSGECVVDERYSTIGGPCTSGQNCSANSVCSGNGICVCPEGTEYENGICIAFEKLGVKKEVGEVSVKTQPVHLTLVPAPYQPGNSGLKLDPDNGSGNVENEINDVTDILPKVNIGHRIPAIATEDILATPLGFFCLPNQLLCARGSGTCIDGLCKCPVTFIPNNSTCIPEIVQPGESCTGGQKCSGLMVDCINNKCMCKMPNEVIISGRCTSRALTSDPGEACRNDGVCTGRAVCVDGMCQCPQGWTLAGGVCQDILFVPIGGECSSVESCAGGSGCADGHCICTDGSVNNRGTCEQVPGGRCAAGQKCVGGSTCQFGKCMCPGGREVVGITCQPKNSKPGDPCQSGEICTGGSRCIFGACLCPPDQVQIDEVCQRSHVPVNPGEDCSDGQHCQGGSYCSSNVCRCPGAQVIVNNICQQGVSRPGESCGNGQRCLGGSECRNFVCQCPIGQVVSNSQCVVPSNAAPGFSCNNGQQCQGRASCIQGVCRCPERETIKDSQCVTTNNPALPGEPCGGVRQSECIRDSFCFAFVCQCQSGLLVRNGQCSLPPDQNSAFPGQSCANNERCIGGSSCLNRVCTCPINQVIVNQQCQAQSYQPQPGQACTPEQQCSGGAQCLNQRCSCPVGEVISNMVCIKFIVDPGQSCLSVQQCGGGSACTNGICSCPVQYTIINGLCVISTIGPGPGQPCLTEQACAGGSSCIQQVCQCPAGQIAMDRVCMNKRLANPGESCANGETCSGGSACMGQVCRCQVNEVVVNAECVQETAGPGGNCDKGQICTGGSRCFATICQCPPGQVAMNSECIVIKTSRPGESCTANEICLGGSTCLQGICQCSAIEQISNGQCVANGGGTSGAGEPCNSGQQCIGNSVCNRQTGYCICPDGTSQKGTICVASIRSNPGGSCANGEQCQGGSNCVQQVCTCPRGEVAVDALCQKILSRPGDYCGAGQQCTGGSTCSHNFCLCPEGTVSFNGECMNQIDPAKNPGQPCLRTQECKGGSSCLNGICICPQDTQIINNICVKTATAGGDCSKGQPCLGGSSCLNNVCTCPQGTTDYNGACTVPQKQPPGGSCSNAQGCTNNAFCSMGTCKCLFGYQSFEQRCIDTQFLSKAGGSCAKSEICTGGSRCVGDVCTCAAPLVAINGVCESGKGASPPGGSCANKEICTGNSFCEPEKRICICRNPYVLVNSKCMSRAAPEGNCAGGEICTGGSVCDGKLCKCPGATTSANGLCMPSNSVSNPGGSCFREELCNGNSICRDSACVCPPGKNVVNDVCMSPQTNVPAGSYCTYTSQCALGLTCLFGVCQCSRSSSFCPGRGRMTSPPGGSCAALQECVGGSQCRDGWCLCPDPSMVVTNGKCIPAGRRVEVPQKPRSEAVVAAPVRSSAEPRVMPPGGYCGDNYVCSGGSICVSGQCLCREGTEIIDNQCVKRQQSQAPKRVPKPLEQCGNVHQPCEGGAVCDGRVCQCPIGTILQNDQCVTVRPSLTSPPYGSCSNGQNCGGNSICDGNYCVCPESYVVQQGKCLPRKRTTPQTQSHNGGRRSANPSEPCHHGEQCLGGSRCNLRSHVCTCPHGTVPVNGRCKIPVRRPTTAGPNQSCASGQRCTGGSRCFNGVCICPRGSFPDSEGNCQTEGVSAIGGVCHSNTKCSSGAICISSRCRCPPGTINSGGACIPLQGQVPNQVRQAAVPGQNCHAGVVCIGGAQCLEGMCKCGNGFVIQDNVCVRVDPEAFSSPGDPCVKSEDCTGGSYCRLGFCVCPLGTESVNLECVPPHNPHSNPSPPNITVGFAAPGYPCTQFQHCTGRSYCVDGLCRCPAGMSPRNGVCQGDSLPSGSVESRSASRGPFPSARPGDSCETGQLCSGGALCSMGVCRCPSGYKPLNGFCSKDVPSGGVEKSGGSWFPPGSVCSAGGECTGGSSCVGGVCMCGKKQVAVGTKCLAIAPSPPQVLVKNTRPQPAVIYPIIVDKDPGETCSSSTRCRGGASCMYGMCRCPIGTVPLHGVCKSNLQFTSPPTTPYNYAPLPTPSAIASQPTNARPGDKCQAGSGVYCIGGSYCDRGTCVCPPGLQHIGGTCTVARVTMPSQPNSVNPPGSLGSSSSIRQKSKGPGTKPMGNRSRPCPLPENPSACQLPNCYCSKEGTDIPGGLPVEDTPQFVVVTLDDAVNGKTINVYKNTIFDGKYTNPNGCPIRGTFFVSHEWTNYDDVQWLYYKGHEIASNSITHKPLQQKPYSRWVAEMDGLRQIAAQFGTIDPSDVVGMRAPQLSVGGDTQFQMMKDMNFLWDNSVTAKPGRDGAPFWPQTLDYTLAFPCQRKGCPESSHPGIWEIPLNQFYGYYIPVISSYKRASMIRAAMGLNETLDSTLQMLRQNFDRAYTTNKAPFVLTINADFLNSLPNNGGIQALQIFLQEMMQKQDVYMVTMTQLVEWMRQPTPLSQINSFAAFNCQQKEGVSRSGKSRKMPCGRGNICNYHTPDLISGEHQLRTCGECPKEYPWIHNPLGRKQ